MENKAVSEQFNAIQHMLLPSGANSEMVRQNTRKFWEGQDAVLDSMQAFANDWFERRHNGTHAALEAAERMSKAETPIDFLREYQDWASGALQQVMADGMACQQQIMVVIGALGQPLAPSGETEPGTSRSARQAARPKAA